MSAHRPLRSLVAGLATLALVAGACGSNGSEAGAADETEKTEKTDIGAVEEGEISRAEPGRLHVEVGGDLEFEWEEEIDLRIVVIRHQEVTAVRFLSVGIEQMQDLSGGAQFRVAFDLAGEYEGAGEYALPAAGGDESPPVSVDPEDPGASNFSGLSKPFLIYTPARGNEATPRIRSFENALKPCEVMVEDDDGGAGRLECPEITDTEGEGRISLTMEWETG